MGGAQATHLAQQAGVKGSPDRGATWEPRGKLNMLWPSMFVHEGALYMIGNHREDRAISITRSGDGGHTDFVSF